jgi:hypothetical protein
MLKLISPFASLVLSPRARELVCLLGVVASITAALIGGASAEPPDPCDWHGF